MIDAKRNSITAWWNAQEQLAANVLQTLGVTWRPRLAHGVFAPPVTTLSGALVQAEQSSSLTPNYIETLLAARDLDDDSFRRPSVQQPPPRTLLYLLLRHSMLLEYAAAASRLLINRGLLQPAQRREPELVDLPLGPVDANRLAADGDEDHRAGVQVRSSLENICSASRPPANPISPGNPN